MGTKGTYFRCLASNLWLRQNLRDLIKVWYLSWCLYDVSGTMAWRAQTGGLHLLEHCRTMVLNFITSCPEGVVDLFLCMAMARHITISHIMIFGSPNFFPALPVECQNGDCPILYLSPLSKSFLSFHPCEIIGDYLLYICLCETSRRISFRSLWRPISRPLVNRNMRIFRWVGYFCSRLSLLGE